jgi:hypothetical protein
MASLKKSALALLASVSGADLQNGDGKTILYTVPPGKKAVVSHCVVRNPTASLAGGTDFDLGDGANADTWKNTVNLSTMTATTDYMLVSGDNAKYTIFDAGDAFGVKPVTGATADAEATIDVFGYEFDA